MAEKVLAFTGFCGNARIDDWAVYLVGIVRLEHEHEHSVSLSGAHMMGVVVYHEAS